MESPSARARRRQRAREEAALQPNEWWIPQRQEAGCPPLGEMRFAERLMVSCFVCMLVVAGSHLILIGPVALLPALSGTFGIIAVMRGIRGLMVVANMAAALFSLVYLVLALVTFPEMYSICAHLAENRAQCHQCPMDSSVEQCHGQVGSEYGPRCYSTTAITPSGGASCLRKKGIEDECAAAALRSRPAHACYCVNDIWDPRWEVTCVDLDEYDDSYVETIAVAFFGLCCIAVLAGVHVGCCDHDRFGRKMSFNHGRGTGRARRVGAAAAGTSEALVSSEAAAPVETLCGTGERGPSGVVLPMQVVDGMVDLTAQALNPLSFSPRGVIDDGGGNNLSASPPRGVTGVVVQAAAPTGRGPGTRRTAEGTLVSQPAAITSPGKVFHVMAAEEELDSDDFGDGDGRWTEL